MDAFEQLVADIFRADGYWVQTNYKVHLSRADKEKIKKPSCPNWDIDVLAYKPASKSLLIVECKNYLDSGGVHARMFEPNNKLSGRYKLFTRPPIREVVMGRMTDQLVRSGMISGDTSPKLTLVCGHVTAGNLSRLQKVSDHEGWDLLGPDWLRLKFEKIAVGGYENNAYASIVKLVMNSKVSDGTLEIGPYSWRSAAEVDKHLDDLMSGKLEGV